MGISLLHFLIKRRKFYLPLGSVVMIQLVFVWWIWLRLVIGCFCNRIHWRVLLKWLIQCSIIFVQLQHARDPRSIFAFKAFNVPIPMIPWKKGWKSWRRNWAQWLILGWKKYVNCFISIELAIGASDIVRLEIVSIRNGNSSILVFKLMILMLLTRQV